MRETVLDLIVNNKYVSDNDRASNNFYDIEILSNSGNISMNEEWYEYSSGSHFWFKWRLMAMFKQIGQLKIPINKKLKVLEVGCGSGNLRQSIEAITNWNVDAADLNMKALSNIVPGRGKTICYNIFDENELLIESYDVVILYDVLEHIENTKPFIESLIKHLKPNGHLLINVPSLNILFSIYDKKMGHFRRYNKKSLINEFKDVNLKIIDTRYWGFFMLPLLIIRTILMFILIKKENKIIKYGFKPPNVYFNKIFNTIARVEIMLLSKPILGTSLLLVGKKSYE